MRDDRRSPEAVQWRKLYKSARWQAIRMQQLRDHALCERCLERGTVVAASVVHHVEPHRGDMAKFFGGPFQSLCSPCHDGDAQSEERVGYSLAIADDGWPIDARHPANK